MSRLRVSVSPVCRISALLVGFAFLNAEAANIEFENATASSQITHSSPSWSACWGDFNGDGWLDFYANNHPTEHSLYINQQDGTFADLHNPIMGYIKRDAHGCAWADFDRDGDEDMLLVSGGNGGRRVIENNFNQFYINEGGLLQDQAAQRNIERGEDRARTPLWFDYDGDGLLDLFLAHILRPDGTGQSVVMRQNGNHSFVDVTQQVGAQINNSVRFAQLSDLSGDGVQDLLTWRGPGGLRAFDIQGIPFQDITSSVSSTSISGGRGTAIADFDGDLRPDIYVANQKVSTGELAQPNANELRMGFGTSETSVNRVRFTTQGSISVQVRGSFIALDEVFIGQAGMHPTDWSFTLDPSIGEYAYQVGVDRGIFVSYIQQTGEWEFALGSPTQVQAAGASLNAIINSSTPITGARPIGFDPTPQLIADSVYINSAGGLVNRSSAWLPSARTPAVGVVAGDFDNDRDVDIYVVNSFEIENRPNTLYENIGGSFVVVANAGGAAGSVDGVGDGAIVADYDRDGFLDIYVMNGRGSPIFGDAVHQLFRNKGNANHWLQLDLKGTVSNPHGVGATVHVDAGGQVQMREQNGGVGKYNVNGHRIHVGLGSATIVDRLTISWPSGIVQELTNVGADQILEVVESQNTGSGGIGDFVWNDLDGDGIQGAPEPGIEGVSVILRDCSGSQLAATNTDANGAYVFSGLSAGNYRLEFAAPAGFDFSPANQGTANNDSDADPASGQTACITLVDQETRTNIDAGLVAAAVPGNAQIGDFVWLDINANGIQESGEPGMAGVTVGLEDCSGNALATTVTDADGSYGFSDLAAGGYKVKFNAPQGHALSPPYEGDRRAIDSDPDWLSGLTDCLQLVDGQTRIGIDAGFNTQSLTISGKIGNRVWQDLNADGVQDNGEPGQSGVSVSLLDCDSNAVLQSTTTDANGIYLFEDLAASRYRVLFEASGQSFSPQFQGERGQDSDPRPASGLTRCFPLSEGQVRLGIDAGLM